jgi:cytochrome P450
MVTVSIQLLHQLPSIWTNPHEFDPERFSDARREDKAHRYAYLPFGGGVHKCIGMYFGGMEVKSVMHQMLLNYEWSVPPAYEMPVNWKALPLPKDGLPITLKRR